VPEPESIPIFAGADADSLPPRGLTGTYALFFRLSSPLEVQAGRLGRVQLPAGWVIYVGSALGAGGLRARLRRHLAADKRVHWHIDALSSRERPELWLALADGRRHECDWAQRLAAHPAATIPAPGFGSSDCKRGCRAHLIALPGEIEAGAITAWLRQETPADLTANA